MAYSNVRWTRCRKGWEVMGRASLEEVLGWNRLWCRKAAGSGCGERRAKAAGWAEWRRQKERDKTVMDSGEMSLCGDGLRTALGGSGKPGREVVGTVAKAEHREGWLSQKGRGPTGVGLSETLLASNGAQQVLDGGGQPGRGAAGTVRKGSALGSLPAPKRAGAMGKVSTQVVLSWNVVQGMLEAVAAGSGGNDQQGGREAMARILRDILPRRNGLRKALEGGGKQGKQDLRQIGNGRSGEIDRKGHQWGVRLNRTALLAGMASMVAEGRERGRTKVGPRTGGGGWRGVAILGKAGLHSHAPEGGGERRAGRGAQQITQKSNGHKKDGESMCTAFENMIDKTETNYGCFIVLFICDNDRGSQRGRKNLGIKRPWLLIAPCCSHQGQLMLGDYLVVNEHAAEIAEQAIEIVHWILSHDRVRKIFDDAQFEKKFKVLVYLVANLTRWTTHYLAFSRLLELRGALRHAMFVLCLVLNPYEGLGRFGEKSEINVFVLSTELVALFHRIPTRPRPKARLVQDDEGRERELSSAFLQYMRGSGPFKPWQQNKAQFQAQHPDEPHLVWESFQDTEGVKELARFAILLLGLVVNQASTERTFSDLKIKKTRLRNRLGTQKLGKMSKVGASIRQENLAAGLIHARAAREVHDPTKVAGLLSVPQYVDALDPDCDEDGNSASNLVKTAASWCAEAGKKTRKSKNFFPRSLALLFGGKISNPVGKPRQKQFTREALMMELLAAEESDEEPDDGALSRAPTRPLNGTAVKKTAVFVDGTGPTRPGFPSRKGDPSNPSNGRERVPRQRVDPSRTRPVLPLARGPRRPGKNPPIPSVDPSKTGTGWSPSTQWVWRRLWSVATSDF
ncbi:hypothetical protein B0H19DRAFT_1285188 [Mycena capillaripes]|nr:hypothetical protein B0H19DRAFT_1285188 [Mycena capillaripes]